MSKRTHPELLVLDPLGGSQLDRKTIADCPAAAFFGILAVFLACIEIYGLLSYSVVDNVPIRVIFPKPTQRPLAGLPAIQVPEDQNFTFHRKMV